MRNKQTILVLLLLVLVAVGAVFGATLVAAAAEDTDGYPPIIQALAERFNLNADDVKEVFDEQHEAKRDKMQQRHEDHLDEAVEAGTLTDEQKEALLKKKEELRVQMDEIKDLPPEERFEAMKETHEEFKAWAEESGIDLKALHNGAGKGRFGPMGRGMGRHKGRGMGHGPRGGFWKGAPPASGSVEQDTLLAL